MLGLTPVPVRWILRLYGAETDKERGIKDLELTAEKGHYLLPYARLLLAMAALRDKNQTRARELLQELSQEFPNNQLYKKELARLR
jgi:predicted Zn-dependent protease